MPLRRRFTLSYAIEKFVLVAFLGCILFSPKILDSSFDLIGKQVKRIEAISDQFAIQCSHYANQLIR